MKESVWTLAISLAAIVAVVWLFLRYSKNYEAEKPKARILYISGYAVLIVIELVVYICMNSYQKDDIMSSISFGATLSSLIMSVVAIIFTIVSGKDGREQLGRINEATEKLQQTACSFDKFQAVAEHIDEELEKLYEKVAGIDKKTEEIKVSTIAINEAKLKQLPLEHPDGTSKGPSNSRVEKFFKSNTLSGLLALYAGELSYEKKKAFDPEKMGTLFNKDNQDYAIGYLYACTSCGILTEKGRWPDWTFVDFNKDYKGKTAPKIEELIVKEQNKNKEYGAFILKLYNEIRTYFGVAPFASSDIKGDNNI